MIVADAIADFLAEKGVSHVFGIIGAGNAALFDALARKASTEIICCHHEAAAVMSATYWGRARGSCGVAVVTTGAGSSNAITGALAANMDSAPLLIISGNEPSKYIQSPDQRVVGVQGFKTHLAARPFCKLALSFNPTMDLSEVYAACMAPRAGAVWLDIPRDYFNAVV